MPENRGKMGFFKGGLLNGGMVGDSVKRLINWAMLKVGEDICCDFR